MLLFYISLYQSPVSLLPSLSLSLSLFHSLSFLKAKRLCRLLGHFPLCHRRSCCCCCPRGKYASISFTPCNVVGLTATPDCAPGLLFNYFVNVFFLSFLPLLSSSFFFFCCCCSLCATSKSQSHWPRALSVLAEISHPSGSCLPAIDLRFDVPCP